MLAGEESGCPLPAELLPLLGTFKHNYQSLRVVDLLELRYDRPGLNLTDQVREGILKHTTWKVSYPFPLPTTDGLRLGLPCHLEGQVVALADEIAQQTHDLEDGLQADAVSLDEVERLAAARAVIERAGDTYRNERRRWRRATLLQRGLIHMFVTDAIQTTARAVDPSRRPPRGERPRRVARHRRRDPGRGGHALAPGDCRCSSSSRRSSTASSSTTRRSTGRTTAPAW